MIPLGTQVSLKLLATVDACKHHLGTGETAAESSAVRTVFQETSRWQGLHQASLHTGGMGSDILAPSFYMAATPVCCLLP